MSKSNWHIEVGTHFVKKIPCLLTDDTRHECTRCGKQAVVRAFFPLEWPAPEAYREYWFLRIREQLGRCDPNRMSNKAFRAKCHEASTSLLEGFHAALPGYVPPERP